MNDELVNRFKRIAIKNAEDLRANSEKLEKTTTERRQLYSTYQLEKVKKQELLRLRNGNKTETLTSVGT